MTKRKIIITGSNGTVAAYVPSVFPNDELVFTTRKNLDITNQIQMDEMFEATRPQVVIHLAAKTNVDDCEKQEKLAMEVNAQGTENIAKACKKFGSSLIYVSSGAVFDGKKKFSTESDVPGPVNVYGRSKLLGEQAVQNVLSDYCIVRAGWVVGGGKKEKKFISFILRQVDEGATTIPAAG